MHGVNCKISGRRGRVSPTVENAGFDGHPRLTREPRTLGRFNPIACFLPGTFSAFDNDRWCWWG